MNRTRKKEPGIFYRFIFSYILLIAVLLLFYIISYRYSYSTLKKQIQSSNYAALQYSISLLDQQFKQIDMLTSGLSDDSSINNALDISIPISDPEYLVYQAAIENFNRYVQNHTLLDSTTTYIYLKNTEKILLPQTMYPNDIFFRQQLKYPYSFYDTWRELLNGEYYESTVLTSASPIYEVDPNNLFYLRSLPHSHFQPIAGTIVIPIQKTGIAAVFSGLSHNDEAHLFILDKNGSKIIDIFGEGDAVTEDFSSMLQDGTQEYRGSAASPNQFFMTYYVSPYNEWRYVCVVPNTVVYEQLYDYRSFSMIFLFVMISIGVLIAMFLAYRNSKPILNAFERHIPVERENLLNKLFKGRVMSREELTAHAGKLGIDLNYNSFGVIAVNCRSRANLEADTDANEKAMIRSTLAGYFGGALIHDLDYKTLAVLINYNGENFREYCQAGVNAINAGLSGMPGLTVYAGAAEVCTDPLDVWLACEQAESALSLADTDTPLVWYADIEAELNAARETAADPDASTVTGDVQSEPEEPLRSSAIIEATKYIDDNYADPDMTLHKISSNFNLSEGYFSVMFKMHAGVNFSDYLEKTRVTHARELIQNTDDSIDDIAFSVGYNSSQTFRRAFKKVFGITPTTLRKG